MTHYDACTSLKQGTLQIGGAELLLGVAEVEAGQRNQRTSCLVPPSKKSLNYQLGSMLKKTTYYMHGQFSTDNGPEISYTII